MKTYIGGGTRARGTHCPGGDGAARCSCTVGAASDIANAIRAYTAVRFSPDPYQESMIRAFERVADGLERIGDTIDATTKRKVR